MSHEDFFNTTSIEFTHWDEGEEKIIAKYNKFEDLPSHLVEHFQASSNSKIILNKKNWKILEINRDLRAHGNGMHVRIRLDPLK